MKNLSSFIFIIFASFIVSSSLNAQCISGQREFSWPTGSGAPNYVGNNYYWTCSIPSGQKITWSVYGSSWAVASPLNSQGSSCSVNFYGPGNFTIVAGVGGSSYYYEVKVSGSSYSTTSITEQAVVNLPNYVEVFNNKN